MDFFFNDSIQSLHTVHFSIIPIEINVHSQNYQDRTMFFIRARLFHLGTENQKIALGAETRNHHNSVNAGHRELKFCV